MPSDHLFLEVANGISLMVVLYSLLPFVISSVFPNTQHIVWSFSVLVAPIVAEALKRTTRVLGLQEWCGRPVGARACDTLNRHQENQGGTPGFPSGHMATTLAFWTGAYILAPPTWRTYVLILGFVGSVAMMWARIEKRCHTVIQTIGGAVLGMGTTALLITKN